MNILVVRDLCALTAMIIAMDIKVKELTSGQPRGRRVHSGRNSPGFSVKEPGGGD